MTNHSYKGLTQPLQTDTTKPRPAKRRVLAAITVATVTAAAAAVVCYKVLTQPLQIDTANLQLLLEQRQVLYQCDCSLNEYY